MQNVQLKLYLAPVLAAVLYSGKRFAARFLAIDKYGTIAARCDTSFLRTPSRKPADDFGMVVRVEKLIIQ